MIDLLQTLIKYDSTTPDQSQCLDWIANHLNHHGFTIEWFNHQGIRNLYMKRVGDNPDIVLFTGHTDTVATGPLSEWTYPPFSCTHKDGYVYGRGMVDMKGAVAAMIFALTQYNHKHTSVALLLTSNEEGDANGNGTEYAVRCLQERGESIGCIINGEPTSKNKIGDCVKIGRRGSLTANITLHGKQGHVAYAHLAANPNKYLIEFLTSCSQHCWSPKDSVSLPTTCEIVELKSGTGFDNVIPDQASCKINWRYTPDCDSDKIKTWVERELGKHSYDIAWKHSAKPFIASPKKLLNIACAAIENTTGIQPQITCDGGTSDARFLVDLSNEIIELGLLHQTAHQIDEHTKYTDVHQLATIYLDIMHQWNHHGQTINHQTTSIGES